MALVFRWRENTGGALSLRAHRWAKGGGALTLTRYIEGSVPHILVQIWASTWIDPTGRHNERPMYRRLLAISGEREELAGLTDELIIDLVRAHYGIGV